MPIHIASKKLLFVFFFQLFPLIPQLLICGFIKNRGANFGAAVEAAQLNILLVAPCWLSDWNLAQRVLFKTRRGITSMTKEQMPRLKEHILNYISDALLFHTV